MGASAAALASFEVAVGGAGSPFPWLELVGIHRQTHRATWFTPVETRSPKDLVQSFVFGLFFDLTGTRHNQCAHTGGNFTSGCDVGGVSQVFDPAVGA